MFFQEDTGQGPQRQTFMLQFLMNSHHAMSVLIVVDLFTDLPSLWYLGSYEVANSVVQGKILATWCTPHPPGDRPCRRGCSHSLFDIRSKIPTLLQVFNWRHSLFAWWSSWWLCTCCFLEYQAIAHIYRLDHDKHAPTFWGTSLKKSLRSVLWRGHVNHLLDSSYSVRL